MLDEHERSNFTIAKVFWWADGESALRQEWPTADFDTWVDRDNTHAQAFGVHFLRADIENMIPAAQRTSLLSVQTTPLVGLVLIEPQTRCGNAYRLHQAKSSFRP